MAATAQTRISGGSWRGRLLSTPREQLLRPTRSVVREAVFNILGDAVGGAPFVDVYCGAGTVGFEALSRGAESATFVDHDLRALAHVRSTAGSLGCADRCLVVRSDALRWMQSRPAGLGRGAIVFVDAPYRDDGVMAVLDALGAAPVSTVVCEHHRARALPDRIGGLVTVRHRHYGITDLSVLQPAGTEEVTGG